MATIEEQIKELEEQISKTKYNKATEGHIGKLKAKIARLTEEEENHNWYGVNFEQAIPMIPALLG